MKQKLEAILKCVEYGKINNATPYPPNMKGQDGADELTKQAIDAGIDPSMILEEALIPAMSNVGNKFSKNEIFVPQMLMSAKAMNCVMKHIRPYFQTGDVNRKGVFIIGTVQGDLHDIGKNLVSMMVEGGGWEVIDLGVDVAPEKFMDQLEKTPSAAVGLSALLTTTMESMGKTVNVLKNKYPGTKILIGGAPVTDEFCMKIGADFFSPDPQGAVNYLNSINK